MAVTIDGAGPLAGATTLNGLTIPTTGFGKVLQVVRATYATSTTTTSTVYVDSGLSVTITPQRDDSNILLIYCFYFQTGSNLPLYFQITDSGNTAISGAEGAAYRTNGGYFQGAENLIGYDSPATLAATTYKGRFKVGGGTGYLNDAANTGQLYAIEVAA